jgi:hypothetical protein
MTKTQKALIESLVVDGLNSQYDNLIKQPFVNDNTFWEFCDIIERTAREWAEECYQFPENIG